jgi:hypothetical protein
MTSTHKNLSVEEFENQFTPITNKVIGGTNTNMDELYTMFETYGPDLEFIKKQPNNKIWTMLDCDGNMVLVSGYHFVNRMYYMITEQPCPDDTTIEVLYARDSKPYPVMWTSEGDNNGLIYGVEWRVYEDELPDGEPDMDSHCEVTDVCWYATAEQRDNELWD